MPDPSLLRNKNPDWQLLRDLNNPFNGELIRWRALYWAMADEPPLPNVMQMLHRSNGGIEQQMNVEERFMEALEEEEGVPSYLGWRRHPRSPAGSWQTLVLT